MASCAYTYSRAYLCTPAAKASVAGFSTPMGKLKHTQNQPGMHPFSHTVTTFSLRALSISAWKRAAASASAFSCSICLRASSDDLCSSQPSLA